jgi:two-component system, cell cycle sensor histidine kinase and response regulator CckA
MRPSLHGPSDTAAQRQRAEDLVRGSEVGTPGFLAALSPEDTQLLLHELRVHQIELEMQNEELRRCQLDLETSRTRYFDLYDLAPVGYLALDHEGLIREANLTASTLLDTSRRDLVRQPFARFIAADDQGTYLRHLKVLLATGAPQVCELRLARTGPQTLWVQVQVAVLHAVGSQPVFRAVLSDVSDRKRTEEILKGSETRYRTMFEASRDAKLLLAGPTWRFASGNPAALTLFGARNQEDLATRTLWHCSPERQPDGAVSATKAAAAIATAMSEGSHFFAWTFLRAGGDEFPASILLTRMEMDGSPLLQATVRDETQVKKLEAMLGQTDRLASMGMLAAGVAHEINNPLVYTLYNIESLAHDLPRLVACVTRCASALRTEVGSAGFAEIVGDAGELLDPAALGEVVDRACEALAGTQRINTISRALWTFSRVENVARTSVDLNYAIECAITMAYNQIKYRGALIKDLGQVPPVWASEGKLSQVFLNLLVNASQALDEGKFGSNRITVRSWSEGQYAYAEVKDTGKGISPENQTRIFEPFFTTKPAGKGSGLGLAICRDIVREFEGDLSVESQIGAWTRFVVRVPIARAASEAAPAATSTTLSVPVRGRILVIDDEELILKSMRRLLMRQHEVLIANSGDEGRDILEGDDAFDVILCDLMMPGMSGMELHEWLKGRNPALAQRMAFISGGTFTADAASYLAGLPNLKLEKPIDAANLRQLVADLIGVSRGRQ